MRTVSRRRALTLGACLGVGGLPAAIGAGEPPGVHPLLGRWTYRSLLNDPDPNTPFGNLEFAVAEIRFEDAPFGQIAGHLTEEHKEEGWPIYQAALVTETQRSCGSA